MREIPGVTHPCGSRTSKNASPLNDDHRGGLDKTALEPACAQSTSGNRRPAQFLQTLATPIPPFEIQCMHYPKAVELHTGDYFRPKNKPLRCALYRHPHS